MTQDTINRYQPGGDFYAKLQSLYGKAGADKAAAAALTGDNTQLNEALAELKFGGQPLNTNTFSLFANQLGTNPLAAPLSGLNSQIGTAFKEFLSNPWVLGSVLIFLFIWLGGLTLVKGAFSKA